MFELIVAQAVFDQWYQLQKQQYPIQHLECLQLDKYNLYRTRWIDDIIFSGRSKALKEASSSIVNAFKLNADNLVVKAKINWLAKYFNEYAVSFGLPKIEVVE